MRMPIYRRALFALFSGRNCHDIGRTTVYPFGEHQTTSVTLLSFSNTSSLNCGRNAATMNNNNNNNNSSSSSRCVR
ncbi:hypothetical protein OS493_032955 [Desmophyllum pertusum]|uniref:Uncharacterized protein n=1 Tax=Desmophyllum pertusum TaxID=174260 RepID=A0A9W9Y9M9_9CNID|nr:hypothetical protein OS493_032955 [Desmophyllum pertusum]